MDTRYHISLRAMMDEKSLFIYWADKVHTAAIISAKMEGHFGFSASSYFGGAKWLRALKRGEDIFEPCVF
jgi:hypothetical protein